jgi:hypothetical protein
MDDIRISLDVINSMVKPCEAQDSPVQEIPNKLNGVKMDTGTAIFDHPADPTVGVSDTKDALDFLLDIVKAGVDSVKEKKIDLGSAMDVIKDAPTAYIGYENIPKELDNLTEEGLSGLKDRIKVKLELTDDVDSVVRTAIDAIVANYKLFIVIKNLKSA